MSKLGSTPVIRVGVSACLLGQEVRYDRGHKRDRYITDVLGKFVDEWVAVCPETECGLPVPRDTIRLEGDPKSPRFVTSATGVDETARMESWAEKKLEELEKLELTAFIFKKDSPSCGAFRVRVYDANGVPRRVGRGLFASALMRRFRHLPIEEEGRLHDIPLRENFIERLFARARWAHLEHEDPTPAGLVDFHSSVKLAVMAHSPTHYKELGRIVADAGKTPWDELAAAYYSRYMTALEELATRGRHVNVLQHLMGYLKRQLDSRDKEELLDLFEDYRTGQVPLIVPITLLKHHLGKLDVPEWVHHQTYLHPYPKELMLRSFV